MKILQATTAIGWSGGTEQCFLLAKYMNDMGYETHILTFRGCELDRRAEKLGIERVYFPNTKKLSLSEAKKLAEIIEGYDVVNTHISKAHWFVWISSFLAKKRPAVVYTRRVLYDISPLSAFTKYSINVDGIVGISPEICKKLQKYPILRKKVYYIPSGIELDRFYSGEEVELRKELSIPADALVVTNVANFSQVKGHHVLLPAFKKFLQTTRKKAFLLLVGRDTCGEESTSLIKKYGLDTQVIPLGFRRDVPRILRATDIFVFPSVKEGLGSSLLQAMATGRIVVASYTGGIKDYLRHMENGIAVEPGSVDSLYRGLLTALENLNNEGMKVSARETAEKFDIKNVARKTLNLYKELLRAPLS
ncbi:glycosyltransferase family 4 protein [Phorcysia thermohydrogeniphila]|uniref:Glycosyltransferase involved in cell wall biosynthesis n=1 Tax=Phorcysia thermohydrogeniphila TaxID=936138 RepID=A0A4R1GEU9_9BACT|nr:glycosyltransferase family 4 protein [Phorcysia thermohydrogeniphila]TCK06528.1 glycosyltransferase involved in cell wall biosynthesis [Phorcysia thermohydrogeniphila]